jgi:hypothetical protein
VTATDGTTYDTVAVPSASFPAVETVHAEIAARKIRKDLSPIAAMKRMPNDDKR